MTELTATVIVESITEFARENFHIPSRYDDGGIMEKFVAISMFTEGGETLRNFTKFNRDFAKAVSVGDVFTLTYRVKEANRVCPESGITYTAVTYCKVGVSKAVAAAEKRAAKVAARKAKLGR